MTAVQKYLPYLSTLAAVAFAYIPISGLYRIAFVYESTETRTAGRFLHTACAAYLWLFGFLAYGTPHKAFLVSAWIIAVAYTVFSLIFLIYMHDREKFVYWLMIYVCFLLFAFICPSSLFFYYACAFSVSGNLYFVKLLSYRLLEGKLHVIGLDTALGLNFFFLAHTLAGVAFRDYPVMISGLCGMCWSLPLIPGVSLAKHRAQLIR